MTLSPYLQEVAKRRTFAIISHPDAGKTTITEKVLLFGQAIQTAGTVKGRGSSQHAKSDWMEMEKQRGISITTSVMQFPYHDCLVNLLDTPGHEDFSEDTYRTLTAVDSVLIPIQCEFYALEGVSQLMSTIELVRKSMNKNLEIQGVILSMFDGRTNLSIQVVEEVKRYFKQKVYTTVIPRNVRLAEAPSYGLPIMEYDPRSNGARAYMEFAEEFLALERVKGKRK